MEARQFCSVCKEWLAMEVVPTSDGDDDGVVWFRCPQCQGFLPKLMNAGEAAAEPAAGEAESSATTAEDAALKEADERAEDSQAQPREEASEPDGETEDDTGDPAEESSEPLAEYAALLVEKDPALAVPYRPWESYEVGQCLHHLAWDDCGVVVAKESLPGGREVIKVYFEEAGVVRLIEKATR